MGLVGGRNTEEFEGRGRGRRERERGVRRGVGREGRAGKKKRRSESTSSTHLYTIIYNDRVDPLGRRPFHPSSPLSHARINRIHSRAHLGPSPRLLEDSSRVSPV